MAMVGVISAKTALINTYLAVFQARADNTLSPTLLAMAFQIRSRKVTTRHVYLVFFFRASECFETDFVVLKGLTYLLGRYVIPKEPHSEDSGPSMGISKYRYVSKRTYV